MNKTIYLIITKGCIACSIMRSILRKVEHNHLDKFTSIVIDFSKTPKFIEENVPLSDFPTIVCVDDNVIKYHVSGTITMKKLEDILQDIKFI